MGIRCNQDCEHCIFDDCILDDDEIDACIFNEKNYKTDEYARQQALKYYRTHREERKQYAKNYRRKYYQENKEQIKEYNKHRLHLKKKGLI